MLATSTVSFTGDVTPGDQVEIEGVSYGVREVDRGTCEGAEGQMPFPVAVGQGFPYVELTAPEGGFFSAEDADSLPPDQAGAAGATPREGAFYLWDHAEVTVRLGDDAALFARRFGVAPQGNAPSDPTGELAGLNHLFQTATTGSPI